MCASIDVVTSASTDYCVESINVAPWHIQALDGADEGNHSQAIEWSVQNSWHEFTLQTTNNKQLESDTHEWLFKILSL